MVKYIVLWRCMKTQKELPFSEGKITVTETATVFEDNVEIEVKIVSGKKYVRLNWIDGLKDYELGLIVGCAYFKIPYIEKHFSEVEVYYKDGNFSNCFPTNISHAFKSGAVPTEIEGFYHIPEFSGYGLNRDGVLINLKDGHVKTWSTLQGEEKTNKLAGYQYCVVYSNGRSMIVYQHRLMAILFLKPESLSGLIVNHKDGNKRNNTLDNLEWVTYSENLIHAWNNRLRFKEPRILMRNLITGEIMSFRSARDCSKFLGDSNGFYVKQRLSDKSEKIYPDYLIFKEDDGTDWQHVVIDEELRLVEQALNIVSRNVFTGDLVYYENLHDAAYLTKVKPDLILDHCRCNKVLPCHGFNFRFKINAKDWPEFEERHLLIFKASPVYPRNGIIVFDKETQTESFYPTIEECARVMSLRKGTIATCASLGKILGKRFEFKYFKLRKESISSEAFRNERTFND